MSFILNQSENQQGKSSDIDADRSVLEDLGYFGGIIQGSQNSQPYGWGALRDFCLRDSTSSAGHDDYGLYFLQTTATTYNSNIGIYNTTSWNPRDFYWRVDFMLPNSGDINFFAGFTPSNTQVPDSMSIEHVGLSYSTERGDPGFMWSSNNSAKNEPIEIYTGVPVIETGIYVFELISNSDGTSFEMLIKDRYKNILSSTTWAPSSGLPTVGNLPGGCGIYGANKSSTSETKSYRLYHMFVLHKHFLQEV